ncbi:50S ribosomal protein L29 [Candidatus Woesearchaeota archaeon]|nr:50S ribosomal protein L29 [Candidatus Woesearchaeota archaeon]
MKAKELRAMNDLDLGNKIMELRKELMKVNSQIAIGTAPKSPGKVREIKRTIARIITISNEKQKGGT